ncbi:hypothetical protein JMJ77_0005515 [Colletotrichum scovillei]|uniref:Uncharacterized protein n=1 Tax=Colletotrichum scovillei TaxID=1209932 RepID=A0A9P7UIT5_9PEZI|nr:hypothetical protein JMJ77_0005515 [Colletotrichum scovillei]KAG7076678.1 hypothetical protein JMJ76_0013939 [Colletotrichum scovillei]KAG7083827.1 hypothetical protein JMJ78_0009269 [Colletotrichum scovillei]
MSRCLCYPREPRLGFRAGNQHRLRVRLLPRELWSLARSASVLPPFLPQLIDQAVAASAKRNFRLACRSLLVLL